MPHFFSYSTPRPVRFRHVAPFLQMNLVITFYEQLSRDYLIQNGHLNDFDPLPAVLGFQLTVEKYLEVIR
jgi:hypothetical protein